MVAIELKRIMRNSPGTQKFVRNAALAKLQAHKDDLMVKFEEDNITQEILGGVNARNISKTLGGDGNLYTFIGFEASEPNPAQRVPAFLNKNITLSQTGKYSEEKSGIRIEFDVLIPTDGELEKEFPMPWEPGTWLYKITDGITGLGEYIYYKFLGPKSRSTAGLEMEYEVREDEFSPKQYFRKMMQDFLKTVDKPN